MFTISFLLMFMQDSVELVDLATFKKQYQAAILATQTVYDHLFISESRNYLAGEKIQYDITGGVCGDFIKRSFDATRDIVNRHDQEFLSRENRFTFIRKKESNQYVLQYYLYFNNDNEFQAAKAEMKGRLPDSFKLPFKNPMLGMKVLEMLDGKLPLHTSVYGKNYSVDRIEKHGKSDHTDFYRIHCTVDNSPDRRHFVDIDPNLAWSVTLVKAQSEEYRLEYGDRIDNVPILRKATFARLMKDEETNQVSIEPHYIIQVNKAEPYLQVDPKEYEIASYGIPKPPRPPVEGEVPQILWIGLAGIVTFMLGVLIIHYVKRKNRKASAAPV